MIPVVGRAPKAGKAAELFSAHADDIERILATITDPNGGYKLTTGVFLHEGGEQWFQSGREGFGAGMPLGSPGFNGNVKMHVEGHAAAFMHHNDIKDGVLVINYPTGPCTNDYGTGCLQMLERMLPAGSQLRVVAPGFDQLFVSASP